MAVDLSLIAANVVAQTGATIQRGIAGETVTAGQVIVVADTGLFVKADSDAAGLKSARGIALNQAHAGQPLAIIRRGDLAMGEVLVPGTVYFASETPGGIQLLGDIVGNEDVILLGIAKSTGVLAVNIQVLAVGVTISPPPPSGYEAEADAYFAAMTVAPDAARSAIINTLILALKTAGIWDKLDVVYLFQSHTSQAGLINAKAPGSFDATEVGSPTFAVDEGFTFDGVANYLDTTFNPSTAGGNFTQNSAMFGARSLTSGTHAVSVAGWFDDVDGVTVNHRFPDDTLTFRINQASRSSVASITDGATFVAANRSGVGTTEVYRDGVAQVVATLPDQTSTALNNHALYIGRSSATGFVAVQISSLYVGGSLTAGEHDALGSIDLAYKQAVEGVDLFAPVDTVTGSTTASLSVNANIGNGTLYWVVTISATPPSKAQVKAGQNSSGTAAAASGSQAVSSTGTKTANATGLTADTAYTAHFMHEDAVGNQSNVLTGDGLTTYVAESQAYFTAMLVPPNAARKTIINKFFKNAKATGAFTKLNRLRLYAGHDPGGAGLINLVSPGTGDATLVGVNTLTVDRGITTNGTDSSIDQNFNPTVDTAHFAQNSACYAYTNLTATAATGSAAGWYDGTDGVTLTSRTTLDFFGFRINQAANSTGVSNSGSGRWVGNRSASNATQAYKSGIAQSVTVAPNQTSTALNNSTFFLGRSSATAYNALLWAADYIGESLTAAEHAALDNAFLEYFMDISVTEFDDLRVGVFGDSITSGSFASDEAHRWANIVATAKGWTVMNAGIAGTVLQNSAWTDGNPHPNNGRDTYVSRLLGANRCAHYCLLCGYNDLRYVNTGSGAFSVANFENDLGEVVAGLIAAGIGRSRIVLGSPPWMSTFGYTQGSAGFTGSNDAINQQYNTAVLNVANTYRTRFADVYQAMKDGGAEALIDTDGIHPNDAGHAVIGYAFLAAINA